jgi:acetyltransferase-like isoleucine patch superfamily enzyme
MLAFVAQKTFNNIVFGLARIRASFWRLFCKRMGKNVFIMKNCYLMSPGGIEMDSHININHHTTISGQGGLKIGNYVLIGPNCNILTSNHHYMNWERPMLQQGAKCGPVIIEDDVWLGANVVVLPDVKIGRGAIVGANAVVTKNVEPFSIVGGIPAKHIKYRFSDEEMEKAKEITCNRK